MRIDLVRYDNTSVAGSRRVLPVMFSATRAPRAFRSHPWIRSCQRSFARPIPNLDNVAADFPRLTIIAAHPGWPWTEELIAVAIHKGNVAIDISGWGSKYIPESLRYDMERRLQDKVLFGSDSPGWSAGQCCDEWEMQGFRPGIIDKLFHHNAARILKLDAAIARAEAAR